MSNPKFPAHLFYETFSTKYILKRSIKNIENSNIDESKELLNQILNILKASLIFLNTNEILKKQKISEILSLEIADFLVFGIEKLKERNEIDIEKAVKEIYKEIKYERAKNSILNTLNENNLLNDCTKTNTKSKNIVDNSISFLMNEYYKNLDSYLSHSYFPKIFYEHVFCITNCESVNETSKAYNLKELQRLMKIYLEKEDVSNFSVKFLDNYLILEDKHLIFNLCLCGDMEDPFWKVMNGYIKLETSTQNKNENGMHDSDNKNRIEQNRSVVNDLNKLYTEESIINEIEQNRSVVNDLNKNDTDNSIYNEIDKNRNENNCATKTKEIFIFSNFTIKDIQNFSFYYSSCLKLTKMHKKLKKSKAKHFCIGNNENFEFNFFNVILKGKIIENKKRLQIVGSKNKNMSSIKEYRREIEQKIKADFVMKILENENCDKTEVKHQQFLDRYVKNISFTFKNGIKYKSKKKESIEELIDVFYKKLLCKKVYKKKGCKIVYNRDIVEIEYKKDDYFVVCKIEKIKLNEMHIKMFAGKCYGNYKKSIEIDYKNNYVVNKQNERTIEMKYDEFNVFIKNNIEYLLCLYDYKKYRFKVRNILYLNVNNEIQLKVEKHNSSNKIDRNSIETFNNIKICKNNLYNVHIKNGYESVHEIISLLDINKLINFYLLKQNLIQKYGQMVKNIQNNSFSVTINHKNGVCFSFSVIFDRTIKIISENVDFMRIANFLINTDLFCNFLVCFQDLFFYDLTLDFIGLRTFLINKKIVVKILNEDFVRIGCDIVKKENILKTIKYN